MDSILFPKIEPYKTDFIKVDDLHTIYYEESGNPSGVPILFIHGGPGIAPTGAARQFFDPKVYRIIIFHQRGCGKSTPHAEIKQNTTSLLISDIEKIREILQIEKWHLFGGSWGSTLSLAYAEEYPQRCSSLILRGIFFCREEEIKWFYEESYIFYPDYFSEYEALLTDEERKNRVESFGKRLNNPDPSIHMPAAIAWVAYEAKCSTPFYDNALVEYMKKEDVALPMARIENHYFQNNIFLPKNSLLENAGKLKDVPIFAVHGRYDLVCPLKNAFDLKAAAPHTQLIVVPDGAHSPFEESMAKALIECTEKAKDI